MRRFQIWNQNSNPRTIEPFFTKKRRKLAKYPIYPIFDGFLVKRVLRCNWIWALMRDLESSQHLASLSITFAIIFTFNFWPPHLPSPVHARFHNADVDGGRELIRPHPRFSILSVVELSEKKTADCSRRVLSIGGAIFGPRSIFDPVFGGQRSIFLWNRQFSIFL